MQNFTWLNNFVGQNFRKAEFNRARKGFTLIELIVVIAIIGILAGIVVTSVNGYINKAKLARANVEAENIGKVFRALYIENGDYPCSIYDYEYSCGDPSITYLYTYFYPKSVGGPGGAYKTPDGEEKNLSDAYNIDWDGYNADYFAENAYYEVYLWDSNGDGKMGCGDVKIYSPTWYYGTKCIINDEEECWCYEQPFQL